MWIKVHWVNEEHIYINNCSTQSVPLINSFLLWQKEYDFVQNGTNYNEFITYFYSKQVYNTIIL